MYFRGDRINMEPLSRVLSQTSTYSGFTLSPLHALWEYRRSPTSQGELRISTSGIVQEMRITNVILCKDGLDWLARETPLSWASYTPPACCQECGSISSSNTRTFSRQEPTLKLSSDMRRDRLNDLMELLGKASTAKGRSLKRSLATILRLPCISCASCSKPKST